MTKRRAMTAIEVLAATVLASLMLSSVMGVLGGLSRQQRQIVADSNCPAAWHDRLAEQLEWDLRNSRELAATAAGVRLVGFAGRSFSSGRPTGRPTIVDYYLLRCDHEQYLVRREEHLDERTNDNWRMEMIGRGIQRVELGSVVIDQAVDGRPSFGPQPLVQRIPDRLIVRLKSVAGESPVFEKSFVLQ